MKILHVPHRYYPDPVGGVEIYLEGLSRELMKHGYHSIITAPGSINSEYVHRGIEVKRFEIDSELTANNYFLYVLKDEIAESNLNNIIASVSPDIIHIHNSNIWIASPLTEIAKRNKIPIVFTYHIPGFTCLRNSLLKWGTEICDGNIDTEICSACIMNRENVPRPVANLFASLPLALSKIPASFNLKGGIWTAIRMKELVNKRNDVLIKTIDNIDRIVALNQWTLDLLINNGVSKDKIKICRHGIEQKKVDVPSNSENDNEETKQLRLVFLGRMNSEKGIDILLKALKRIPNADLTLDIYGIILNSDTDYEKKIRHLVNKDKRVILKENVDNSKILSLLSNYDFLVIPSQWYETGPLVVLEAFAAGIPVIGSDLGGIRELVRHNSNGLLIKHDSVREWADALYGLTKDKKTCQNLKLNIKNPRHTRDVAQDMIKIYNELVTT